MEQVTLIKKDGSGNINLFSKDPFCTITSAAQKTVVMGDDTVQLGITSSFFIDFNIGDKIIIGASEYSIRTNATRTIQGEDNYTFDVIFYGVIYELMKSLYRNTDANGNSTQSDFDLTYSLKDFIKVVVYNTNRDYPGLWAFDEANCPDTEPQTMQFSKQNCLQALQNICTQFNFEFRIDQANGVRTIKAGNFGNVVTPPGGNAFFEWGKGTGLYKLAEQKVDDSSVITRLWVEGGTTNIRSDYRNYSTRLQLPYPQRLNTKAHTLKTTGAVIAAGSEMIGITEDTKRYIEDATLKNSIGSIEDTKSYDNIFPYRTGVVSSLGKDIYTFDDDSMDFDLNAKDANGNTLYLIAGTSAKITFITGLLAGQQFELSSYDATSKAFVIVKYTDERGMDFPTSTSSAFRIQVGDQYKITDINLPASYESDAEEDLWYAGYDDFLSRKQAKVQYGLTFDRSYFLDNIVDVDAIVFNVGDYVPVKDVRFSLEKNIRIQQISRNLLLDQDWGLTLSDTTSISIIAQTVLNVMQHSVIINNNHLGDLAKAKRNWRTSEELLTLLNSVMAEMLLVANAGGQYDTTITFATNVNGNANHVVSTAGVLKHIQYVAAPQYGVWNVGASDILSTNDATPYYIYIKCSKTDQTAVVVYSLTKIGVEEIFGFYHFPYGILSSVIGGERSLSTMKGFTQIIGDAIKTGSITGNRLLIDLDNGRIQGILTFDDGTDAKSAVANAQSLAQGAQDYIDNVLPTTLSGLQSQIDGQIDSFFYDYTPTTSNYPASDWATDTIKQQHVGDTFTNTQAFVDNTTTPDAGKSWRWVNNSGVYSWTPIADSDAVKALLAASKAQDTADGKRRVFVITPTPPYEVGDLWAGGITGDLKRCKLARLTGSYTNTDWEPATKYTDDTLAKIAQNAAQNAQTNATNALDQLANITSDDVLSAAEKPAERSRWNDISAEKAGIDSQADTYSTTTEKTAYDNAFQTLATYLNAGTAWTSGVPLWLVDGNLSSDTTIVGADYRTNWNNYFSTRQALLNAIYAKAKALADAAQTAANNANTAIAQVSSDGYLTPSDKLQVLQIWNGIVSERSSLETLATAFAVDSTAYETTYQTLLTYVNTLSLSNGTGQTITKTDFNTNFGNYFTARATLNSSISTAQKTLQGVTVNGTTFLQNGLVNASLIDVANLFAKHIYTAASGARLTLNEVFNNTDTNELRAYDGSGNLMIRLGIDTDGLAKLMFFNSSGAKIYELSQNGIVSMNSVAASFTAYMMYKLTSTDINSTTEVEVVTLSSNSTIYAYNAGNDINTTNNKQYEAYKWTANTMNTTESPTGSHISDGLYTLYGNASVRVYNPGQQTEYKVYTRTVSQYSNGIVTNSKIDSWTVYTYQ